MSAPLVIRAGAATDRGRHRETNEDSLVVTRTMCAVADGMGGHEAGEIASALAVRTLGGSPLFSSRSPTGVRIPAEPEPPEDVARFRARIEREMKLDPEIPADALELVRKLRAVLHEADRSIQEELGGRAGTTVTGAWLVEIDEDPFWVVFNIGDSRTYRLLRPEGEHPAPDHAAVSKRATDQFSAYTEAGVDITEVIPIPDERVVPPSEVGFDEGPATERLTPVPPAAEAPQPELQQVTVDHSEVQYLVSIGQITPAQAMVHPRRNVITRALGTGQVWEPDVWVMPAHAGDRLVLCSDGLTGEVSVAHIARVVHSVPHPKEAADVLVNATLRTGARDNVTVIVADAVGSRPADEDTTTFVPIELRHELDDDGPGRRG